MINNLVAEKQRSIAIQNEIFMRKSLILKCTFTKMSLKHQKNNIPAFFEKTNGWFQKSTKTKMTAMPKSIDSNGRFTFFY